MNLHNFARRLSPFLTAYLLLVSLGLPLHKVYCACRGESEISLFSPEHACGHDEAILANKRLPGLAESDVVAAVLAEDEQEKPAPSKKTSCCSSEKSACLLAGADGDDDHRCGDNEETILAKLTTDYLVEKQEYGQLILATALPAPFSAEELPPRVMAEKATPIRGPAPPPLPYGRELLLRRQLFLC